MQLRLALALFISVVLVGGTLWVRLSNGAAIKYDLALVEPTMQEGELVEYFLDENPATLTPKQNKTELLGRRLILDYINLAANGQISQEDIAALAEKHVSSFAAIVDAKTIDYTDLKIAQNSGASFQKYADEITEIHRTYTKNIEDRYGKVNINALDSNFYSLTSAMSSVYNDTASKLKDTTVPEALADMHLELINIYLSNAYSMEALSETETDPAESFAGLLALSNNVEKEIAIFVEISRVLNANGI